MDIGSVPRLFCPPPGGAYYQFGTGYFIPRGGVFVFGSNLKGIHGAGAAKLASKNFGALFGIGEGFFTKMGIDRTFWTRSYALPTKSTPYVSLPLSEVEKKIANFVSTTDMATLDEKGSQLWFYLTPVGTGLAGFKDEEIAPLFKEACNCWFPDTWRPYLGDKPTYQELKERNEQHQPTSTVSS